MKNSKICKTKFHQNYNNLCESDTYSSGKGNFFLQNRKMWEMAASYKDKILQKNHLISKQILNIEVHTCFISKHVSITIFFRKGWRFEVYYCVCNNYCFQNKKAKVHGSKQMRIAGVQ